jgi:hypothetical protein
MMMEITIDGSAQNKKLVNAVLPSMIRQLKLENCRKGLLIRIYNECDQEAHGVTHDFTNLTNCYVVVVKPQRNVFQLGITLAHELVHVKQMAKGQLKTDVYGNNYWMGKKYKASTKYYDRPWEIAAFAQQELLLRRAVEECA